MAASPEFVFVFSGKRKSGKDYVANLLQQKLSETRCGILRLASPLKKQYALDHNLNYEMLLDSSSYKEKYRAAMIKWGEDKCEEDPYYFCCLGTSPSITSEAEKSIWIISDARRPTHMDYFRKNYPNKLKTVRIVADNNVRKQRGFQFVAGIDDAMSECALDDYQQWDFIISNNGDDVKLNSQVEEMVKCIPSADQMLQKTRIFDAFMQTIFDVISSDNDASVQMEDQAEHYRHLMLFYYRKGKKATETCIKICQMYGENAVTERVCQKWFARFRKGNFSVRDAPRSGRPKIVDSDQVKAVVEQDCHLTTRQIADILKISKSSVENELHKLGYVSKLDVWVPPS